MKFYDPTSTKKHVVLAEGGGEAYAVIHVYPKQKGALGIHVQSVVLRERADPRRSKPVYALNFDLHEH